MKELKQISKGSARCRSQACYSENVLQFIIKASVTDFIFSKTPCFQHILLNSFRRYHPKYENYSSSSILFSTLKQQSDYKINFANIFNANVLNMKAASPI